MYVFSNKTNEILSKYRSHLEIVDSLPIGFTGAASERPALIESDEVSADVLWFALGVDFDVSDVLVNITSRTPQYNWMLSSRSTPQLTPIGAVAGNSSQVMPLLPLIQPFFVEANGVLQFQFQNSATAAVTGGIITLRGLKLVDPIDGGWSYYQG